MQRQPIGRRTSASAWLLITLLLPSLVACGSGVSTAGLSGLDPATTTVTLRFRDSSVPPEYHRSYVLTVSEGQVHVVVDSYGDVLHDVTKPLPNDDWAKFVHGLGASWPSSHSLNDPARDAPAEPGLSSPSTTAPATGLTSTWTIV